MKVFKKILLILLLILIIMPFKVHAEPVSNEEYDFNLYEFDYIEEMKKISESNDFDISELPQDVIAFLLLVDNSDLVRTEQEYLENRVPKKLSVYLNSDDKLIYEINIDIEKLEELQSNDISDAISINFEIFDQYTIADNFSFTVTDEEKEHMESDFSVEQMIQIKERFPYSKINVILSEADDTKDGVYINRVILSEKTDTTIVNNNPAVDGLLLDLDLEFKNVGDYALYRIDIINNTDKEYQINDAPVYGTDNYVKYEFSFEDNSNILKPNTKKIMYVKASYDKEIPQEVFAAAPGGNGFVENKKIEVALVSETGDVGNPDTSDNLMTSVLLIMISIAIIIVMIKVQALRKGLMIVLAGVILIPTIANAIEKLNITINAKIEIKNPHKKFCVYKDVERTEKEYYDYLDGTTWNEYYEENSDLPFFNDYGHVEFDYYHYEYEECVYSPNPYQQNLNTYGFDIVGIDFNGRYIDCDTGREEMIKEDEIESSEYGCYVIEARYYE